jgi:hypothetical protein
MPLGNSNWERFVTAVHRRLMLLRAIEALGRGLLICSMLAIVLTMIAIWQSMPSMPIVLLCGLLALLMGCGLSIHRWPTRAMAAAEIDRQLQLDDLLTTVLLNGARQDDAFTRAVSAMADARCVQHRPSEVLLRRFGIRTWTGIGLCMCIAVTLASIPLSPSRSQAVDANALVLSAGATPAGQPIPQNRGAVVAANEPNSPSDAHWQAQDSAASAANTNARGADPKQGSGAAGIGGGSSVTPAATTANRRDLHGASREPSEFGTAAGGGAASAKSAARGEQSGGTESATAGTPSSTPQSIGTDSAKPQNTTPAATENAPAEYRDLIRAFFQRN